MLKIVLIRPGSTDFDEQGRIKGCLDVPLNKHGAAQVAQTISELSDIKIDLVYTSPCEACRQTAEALRRERDIKVRELDSLRNIDQGLWHGRLIEDVKRTQPRVYRQFQFHPETICPPNGEPLQAARQRVASVIIKLRRKHRRGVIALVVPEPLASMFRSSLKHVELGDLWKVQCQCGGWEQYPVGALNPTAIPDQV